MWKEAAIPLQGDPVWRYLERRGCLPAVMPSTLRFHPALPYWTADGGKPVRLGSYPAMLAAVQGADGITVAIHRTYLQHDGCKAVVRDPVSGDSLPVKKLKARKEGVMPWERLFGCFGLWRSASGRGRIETASAVHVMTGAPVWACVSASGLGFGGFAAGGQGGVCCWRSRSKRGLARAAQALAERMKQEGRAGCVLFPSTPATDWLDVLNAERSPA